MRGKIGLLALAACLLLSGCGWLNGSYISVVPHQEQRQNTQTEAISASNYSELVEALEELIATGTETAAINVAEYPADAVEIGMSMASYRVMKDYPLGAYAVKQIEYELGTSVGQPAAAVTIHYHHGFAEIQRIRTVADAEEAERVVTEALEAFDAGVVLLEETYALRDFTQIVQDYARENPQTVMETPQVTEAVYGRGRSRVVELVFTYQNGRDSLRRMQSEVKPVFDSAALYVSGDGADRQKYAQLYAFLMERFDYKYETSITPAYSLLRHGVGDSRAFATVYAAMCRGAGLECMVITGTHAGEPWTWNIVMDSGHYFHVDLLRCNELGGFREFTDGEMKEYVWDYSAYPACAGASRPAETQPETAAETDAPQETESVRPVQPQPSTEPSELTEPTVPETSEELIEDF